MRALEDSRIHSREGIDYKIDPSAPPKPPIEHWARWVREIRGGMLAGAFYIERNIDVAIESYFLGPTAGNDDDRSETFVEEILNQLPLDRKINLAKAIYRQKFDTDFQRFSDGLGKIKAIRNAMAHKPCWFEPIVDANGILTGVAPYINVGKQATCLIDPTIPQWNRLVVQMITMTENLANVVVDPQSVPKDIPADDIGSDEPG